MGHPGVTPLPSHSDCPPGSVCPGTPGRSSCAAAAVGLCAPSGLSGPQAGSEVIEDTDSRRARTLEAATPACACPGTPGCRGAAAAVGLCAPSGLSGPQAGSEVIEETDSRRTRAPAAAIPACACPGTPGCRGAAAAVGLCAPSGLSGPQAGSEVVEDTDSRRARAPGAAPPPVPPRAMSGAPPRRPASIPDSAAARPAFKPASPGGAGL